MAQEIVFVTGLPEPISQANGEVLRPRRPDDYWLPTMRANYVSYYSPNRETKKTTHGPKSLSSFSGGIADFTV